ncbi:1847_t:CDS:2, partial [Rhizophagus irregularis]
DEDDEENSMISAAFSSEDDPTLSYLTFRFWFFTSLCAAISQFYHFHPNNGDFSPFLWCLYLMLLEDGWQEYYQRKNFKFCDGALVSTQDHSISKNTF